DRPLALAAAFDPRQTLLHIADPLAERVHHRLVIEMRAQNSREHVRQMRHALDGIAQCLIISLGELRLELFPQKLMLLKLDRKLGMHGLLRAIGLPSASDLS